MAKSFRFVFKVLPNSKGGWKITRKDPDATRVIKPTATTLKRYGNPHTKAAHVKVARAAARATYNQGHNAQLIVYGRNGRIQFENTYGDDPTRSKG